MSLEEHIIIMKELLDNASECKELLIKYSDKVSGDRYVRQVDDFVNFIENHFLFYKRDDLFYDFFSEKNILVIKSYLDVISNVEENSKWGCVYYLKNLMDPFIKLKRVYGGSNPDKKINSNSLSKLLISFVKLDQANDTTSFIESTGTVLNALLSNYSYEHNYEFDLLQKIGEESLDDKNWIEELNKLKRLCREPDFLRLYANFWKDCVDCNLGDQMFDLMDKFYNKLHSDYTLDSSIGHWSYVKKFSVHLRDPILKLDLAKEDMANIGGIYKKSSDFVLNNSERRRKGYSSLTNYQRVLLTKYLADTLNYPLFSKKELFDKRIILDKWMSDIESLIQDDPLLAQFNFKIGSKIYPTLYHNDSSLNLIKKPNPFNFSDQEMVKIIGVYDLCENVVKVNCGCNTELFFPEVKLGNSFFEALNNVINDGNSISEKRESLVSYVTNLKKLIKTDPELFKTQFMQSYKEVGA